MSASNVDLELMIRDQARTISSLEARIRALEGLMDTHTHLAITENGNRYATSNSHHKGYLYG